MTVDEPLRISGPRQRVPILALLAANAVSETGNVLAFVAIPWFVLQTTGSAVRTGLTGAAFLLAAVMAGIFGGPVGDRTCQLGVPGHPVRLVAPRPAAGRTSDNFVRARQRAVDRRCDLRSLGRAGRDAGSRTAFGSRTAPRRPVSRRARGRPGVYPP